MSAERRDRAAEVRERVRKTMREAAEQQPNAVERLEMHGAEVPLREGLFRARRLG